MKKPLTIDIKVRVDEETNNRLIKYADKNNITRADVIRKGIDKILDE